MSPETSISMRPEARQELLSRLSERASPVYFSMLASEQQASVVRQRDGGFLVTSTTVEKLSADSRLSLKSCETARYSADGRFQRGNFSEWHQLEKPDASVEVIKEQSRIIDQGSGDRLLRHIKSLTGQTGLGSQGNPFEGAKLPFFVDRALGG